MAPSLPPATTDAAFAQGRAASSLGDCVVALWRLARPPIWMVSLVPLCVGNLLATRTMVPSFDGARGLLLAMVVLGPLAWAAALAINDVHDLAGDLGNPRKQHSVLVSGVLSPTFVRRAAYGSATATLIGAALISTSFVVVCVTFLVLAWCYSVPPIRLKARAGADLLVNAIGVGALPVLAGWTVTRPVRSFPWVMLAQGVLVAAALYIPTTLVDHDADLAAGYRTLSTRLGYERAYHIGFVAWTIASVGAVALSFSAIVIPRQMLPVLVAAAPLLIGAYHLLIGRACGPAQVVRGIIVVSWMFLVPNVMFALMYTGIWLP